MPVSRVAIGEPGCKVRIATKSIAAFVVYGQPFAHAMRELLEFHPSLRAGLGSGYQLFEWLKGIETIPEFVMVGDFEAATDHIQHRAGKIAMRQLLRVLNADQNGYAVNYVDLLFSPRVIEEDGVVTITNSGSLMGEPGTKIALTFLAFVANCYAHGRPSRFFATAGDDQIDAGPDPEVLCRYAEASKVTTMVPSMSKWGVFRHLAVYCQQLLDVSSDDPKNAEIPVPKPRLLSRETKGGRGDHDTNPSFGKARQFAKEYQWSPFTDLKHSMILMFLRNMSYFIEGKPEAFLSTEWGGLGLPGFPQSVIVKKLPLWHQHLIAHREKGDPGAKKILASWSNPKLYTRGMPEVGSNIYLDLITEFLPTETISMLDTHLDPKMRHREKLKVLASEGWIPTLEIISMIENSQTYANIWDINVSNQRGFASQSWSQRSEKMRKACLKQAPLLLDTVPDQPSWQPGLLTYASEVFCLRELTDVDCDNLEEGELRHEVVPLIGAVASPRLFLHYDNNRLILNSTSRKNPLDLDSCCGNILDVTGIG